MDKIQISADVMWNLVDEDVVLLNLASGVYFALGGVGRRFWELIAQGVAGDELIQQVAAEYEVDEAELRSDLDSLAEDLAAEGLILRD